jgi:hypothetical protein
LYLVISPEKNKCGTTTFWRILSTMVIIHQPSQQNSLFSKFNREFLDNIQEGTEGPRSYLYLRSSNPSHHFTLVTVASLPLASKQGTPITTVKNCILYRPDTNAAMLWKTGCTRRGHIWEGKGKRRKLRKWIWLMYFLYEAEYRIFKLVETTIRKGLK